MPNRLLAAVVVVSVYVPGAAAAQPASDWFYTQAGFVVGGAALFGLTRMSAASCGIGCENDMPVGAELMAAGMGAGIGALAGFAADRLRGGKAPSVSLRAGPIFGYLATRSSQVAGAANGAGAVAAVQLSRVLSVHGEYTAMRGSFMARPGSIDPSVLANVVPDTSRVAGWSRGIEHVRYNAVFSEMIGIHPWNWNGVRLELLGGVAVHAKETFSYYDAGLGTFKVLNFAAPDLGAVFGGNAEIALGRHVAVVPMVRYYTRNDPGPTLSYAVGALYRF